MSRFSALVIATTLALGTLTGQANAASIELSTCVAKSVRDAGCSPTDVECMCEGAADGSFLINVLSAMMQYCSTDDTIDSILVPLQAACKSEDIDVPQSVVEEVEEVADSVGFGGSTSGSDDSDDGDDDDSSATVTTTTTKGNSSPTTTAGGSNDDDDSAATATSTGTADPTIIDSTAVISTGSAATATLIIAPTESETTFASVTPTTSSGASATDDESQASETSGAADDDSAGVSTQASFGAVVLGLAAAALMW